MSYEFETRIRYSQTGTDTLLSLPALVDLFQDIATENATEVQKAAPAEEMEKLVWFLVAWQIDVFRYPACGEEVVVGTFPYKFGGSTGLRNLYLKSKSGEVLAYGDATWALMNRETGSMTRVPSWLSELFVLEEKLPMDYKGRRIELPEQANALAPVRVGAQHLDSNLHMNNGQYVRVALAALQEDGKVGIGPRYSRLRVEYRKSAKLRDVLTPFVAYEEGRHVVVLRDEKDCYAVVAAEGGR